MIAGVTLAVDVDADEATVKGLVIFPSVWQTLAEALREPGNDLNAGLATDDAKYEDDATAVDS